MSPAWLMTHCSSSTAIPPGTSSHSATMRRRTRAIPAATAKSAANWRTRLSRLAGVWRRNSHLLDVFAAAVRARCTALFRVFSHSNEEHLIAVIANEFVNVHTFTSKDLIRFSNPDTCFPPSMELRCCRLHCPLHRLRELLLSDCAEMSSSAAAASRRTGCDN